MIAGTASELVDELKVFTPEEIFVPNLITKT
jgi:hypothetical protein